jgi:methionyl-tRNA formyltransferase
VLQDAGLELAAVIHADPEAAAMQIPSGPGRGPLYRASSPRATRLLLEHLQPDLVVAGCYPWRLSGRARTAARRGVLNIHPSLLPRGRGPDPVFWVYRNGERDTGVTVHLMDDGLDSGPILAQHRLAVPEGMDADSLERHLFGIGASMTAALAPRVLSGDAVFHPQDDAAATYQPVPAAGDWIISPLLPAAWAWRFAKGVEPLQGPLVVQTRGKLVPVRRAISWGEHGAPPAEPHHGAILVQLHPGWVLFEQ